MEVFGKIINRLNTKPKLIIMGFSVLAVSMFFVELGIRWHSVRNSDGLTRGLIANKKLKAGTQINLSDLEIAPIKKEESKKRYLLTDQDLAQFFNQLLLVDVEQGSPLYADYFYTGNKTSQSIKIPEGKRGYFLETTSLYWVESGSKVDVVVNPIDEFGGSPFFIENVLVLSVEAERDNPGVTVALSPDEIEILQSKFRTGKIVLAVRNPSDKLRGRASKKAKHLFTKKVKVEVITEE